jgi:hypothetical protein
MVNHICKLRIRISCSQIVTHSRDGWIWMQVKDNVNFPTVWSRDYRKSKSVNWWEINIPWGAYFPWQVCALLIIERSCNSIYKKLVIIYWHRSEPQSLLHKTVYATVPCHQFPLEALPESSSPPSFLYW